jgi:hypothetical protein
MFQLKKLCKEDKKKLNEKATANTYSKICKSNFEKN